MTCLKHGQVCWIMHGEKTKLTIFFRKREVNMFKKRKQSLKDCYICNKHVLGLVISVRLG